MKKMNSSQWHFRGVLFALLALTFSLSAYAQQITVHGVVTDPSGEPLIGASVAEEAKPANGTATDIDGNFTLNVPQGAKLKFSYVGYTSKSVAAQPTMNVVLSEDEQLLEEVVVIGYGSVKRKDVTTAISSVSTADIDRRPIISAGQAIQGRAAGVQVVSASGQPGGDLSIRVRGTTSFNGSNDPLYVVDGVPVDNINFLSPNDIADMQILKDASSAAIYGSRAANGVVLITTKAGLDSQKAKVTLNAQVGITHVAKKVDVLNSAQYKELQDEIGLINLPEGLPDQTDWFDEAYTTGNTQNYQIAISNGNDMMKYYLSAGYQREKGILDVSYFQRYNFRASVEGKVRPWLSVNANISYADYSSNGAGAMGTGSGRGGTVLSVINTPTYAPIWDPLNPGQYYNNFYGIANITNPRENMSRAENNKSKENRLIASGQLLFNIIKGLTFRSQFTLDRRSGVSTSFLDPIKSDYGRTQHGTASDSRNTNTLLIWDNVANYNFSILKNNFDVMLGSSWTDSDYTNNWINGSHFRNGDIQTLNAANKISWTGTGSGASQWGILSFFGRVQYNYDSKYLLTANMRVDGSSRLHPDYRWGVFPSFSGAWRISSENFMESTRDWLDDLKIRAGWGKTGNQGGISDYAYLQRYNINRVDWTVEGQENAVPTITPSNLRTKDLKWETTTQTNLGFDITTFNNRLIFNFDVYYKKTSDMLMWVSLPASGSSVASSIQRNEGEMENKGLEFNIHSVNFQGDFEWTTDFNMSFNKNKLTKLALQKIYTTATTSEVVNEAVVRNEEGRALGGFYGYISDGVDPETGELMYRDINGDGRISTSDRTYIGDPNPDFTFGLTNNFSYKNFTLSIFLQGSYGNDVFNASRMETEGMYDGKNQSTRVLSRWRIPGQITDVPKAGFDMKNSTYFIEDGSYLRVKDISLSYNITSKALRKLGISKLMPYFTATNLLTWTNYSGQDPEVNQWGNSGAVQGIDWGTYPHCKSYVFGINVEF